MKFSKNTFTLLIFSSFLFGTAYSQSIDSVKEEPNASAFEYPNIIKLNSLALAFNNISLIYERGIIPRVSAGIGVGYKYKGAAPSLLNIDNSAMNVAFDDLTGFSITPEAKYYLRACDPGKLEGFYTGVYFRYTRYNSAANFEYTPENRPSENYYADIGIAEFGVGIQLGYQMIIKERFSIDFLFVGPRFSSYDMGYEFNRPPSEAFLNDLSEGLNDVIDKLGFDYNVDIKRENEAKANSSFSFANMRFGLSLGYAF